MDLIPRLNQALDGRYAIERQLGAGGMAIVYLAGDLRHRRKVAIKVLRPELAETLGPERFLREIETAAGLHHPHILPLYDSGEAGGFLFYVMPLVEGESLRDRLAREKQLPIDDALRIAAEVADALSYAHDHGVVHRDIKPENILLQSGHAIVADFGIAKAVASAGDATSLTATGTSIGTPAYMSPEQAAGERDLDGRSDLYSLGCVLYEMLAGQPPFSGVTAEAIVRQHLVSPPPPVVQYRPTVPMPVSGALGRALAKSPADRFNRVGQFAAALTARGSPTVEVPRRRPANRGVPVAIVVAVLLFLGIAWSFMHRSSSDRGGAVRSIAVLPFANLGNDSSNTPMVLGVHAELITQLTKLANLQVTSRSSALEYQDSRKTEKEIAHELGVTALVTGSIQRSGDQIRFTIALSDAEKGAQLWAESYDRDYTAENLFAIQADIARSVAGALSLRLSPGQDTANARPPTRNLAALNLYYRSLADWDNRQNLLDDSAAVRLRAAVALDTAFGAAWGLLAQMESWYLRAGQASDTLPASQALRRVQSLLPGSLEATLAAGYYDYYAKGDFQGALTAMDQAARQQPGSTDISQVRALLLRRLGRWDEAVTLLEQVHRLEPRKVIVMIDLGTCYQVLRRWDQALTTFGQVLAQSPGDPSALNGQQLTLVLKGDTAAAAHVGDSSAVVEPQVRAIIESQTALIRRDYAAAASVLQAWPTTSFTAGYGNRLSQAALLNWLGGDSARMRLAVDSLLATNVAARAKRTRPGPGDPFGARSTVMMTSALGYALRHERTRAIALVDSALALYPPAGDAIDGVIALRMVAIVYLVAGDPDRAVAALHTLLSYPSAMSSAYLRLDPTWDRLRSHPGFQQLLTESHEPHSS